ncbi:MAG: T9SS C-terminal target domain-containing protein [Chitinophagia bacterium]|nr:T9SS C-terminal target domain-containing protein [Chitinophagia bacterium]
MEKRILFIVALLGVLHSHAQTPVWSTDIAPILYNHCTSCHHSGGIAPFSLIGYTNALAYATPIKNDVTTLKMPPWPPQPSYSHLAHERVLSTTEINKIVNWANGGAPSGDLSLAPPDPTYSTSGVLPGTADLTLQIPVYTSTATTGDIYQCFSIPSGLLTDKYITAFEAVPGNPAIVHHVLVYADTTGTCRRLDSTYAGPGYPNFGGAGSSSAILIGAWVPGSAPMTYPTNFGVKLPRRSDVVLQIHYPAGTTGLRDSTKVRFYFSTASSVRDVFIVPVLNHSTNIDSTLFIPAYTTKSFTESAISPIDFSLLAVAPHMHLLGQRIKVYGVHPAGDTDKWINIPKWDFHWQGFYSFPKIKKVPMSTQMRAEAFYDNTTANPDNPSSPPRNVSLGEATTDEMMLVYFVFAGYIAGDENIVIDSATLSVPKDFAQYYRGQQLLDICPNPSVNDLVVKLYLNNAATATLQILDEQGKIVRMLSQNKPLDKGYNALKYSVMDIPPGNYVVQMITPERILAQKLVITH